jgi:hypothetical protein
MKKILFLIIILFPLALSAQKQRKPKPSKETEDSIGYYNMQLGMLWRRAYDSMRASDSFKIYRERRDYHAARSNNYSAFVLYLDFMHTDYSAYNKILAAKGFTNMDHTSARLGFGISTKQGRLMSDLNFITFGFNTKSEKGDEEIKSRLTSVLEVNMGIDLLKSQSVSIYPYAGLGLRISDLEYSKPTQTNPVYTDISDIIINKQSINASRVSLGYQAGIGFDFTIDNDITHTQRTILFVKAGINRPFKETSYKIEGIKFKPGIIQGDWLITIGVKFAGRN